LLHKFRTYFLPTSLLYVSILLRRRRDYSKQMQCGGDGGRRNRKRE
jgi:hypothetical protein